MHQTPPKYLLKFFRWFCNPDYAEDIEGDLLERYERRLQQKGKYSAHGFLLKEVILLLRPGIVRAIEGTQKLNYYGMLKHYTKVGWRNILRSKTDSLINIIGLSTGMAICLATLIFVRYESTFDHHHQLSDRTYRVVQHTQRGNGGFYWNTTAYPLAEALRNDLSGLAMVTQLAGPFQSILSAKNPGQEKIKIQEDGILYVDQHYPAVFDFTWVQGTPDNALEGLNSIVLSKTTAAKLFPDEVERNNSILGKVIDMDQGMLLTVTGVVEDPLPNSNFKFSSLISYSSFKKLDPFRSGNWSGNYQGTTFVVLPENGDAAQEENNINQLKSKYMNEQDQQMISYFLQPLQDIHTETLYGSVPGGYQIAKKTLRIAVFVSIFILLVAIINYINLTTAKVSIRLREVGIRKVIGSSTPVLFGQFLLENSILVLISMVLGIGIVTFLLSSINDFLSIIDLQLTLLPADFLLILLISSGTILLSSTLPALTMATFKPIHALKGKLTSSGAKSLTLRRGLTLFQFTIVQLFVISSIVVSNQLNFFHNQHLGFSTDAIIMTQVPEFDKIDVYKNILLQDSRITDISVGSGPPMAIEDFSLGTVFRLPHEDKQDGESAEMKIIDPQYLSLYDIKLLAGKNFVDNKPQFDEFIINEKLSKSMGWSAEEAIGKRLMINEGEATVVGVVEDFHNNSLQHSITPTVLMNWTAFQSRAFIKINSRYAIVEIEETWKALFPESVFSYTYLDDAIEREYLIEDLILNAFQFFSFLVILIGCLGLYGLVSFLTLTKVKEIGIRKVLGATVYQITHYFSRESAIIIMVAFIVAAPISYLAMDQWLQGFTYSVNLDIWIFVLGGLATLLLGYGVSLIKSLRAAYANPVKSLRDE